MVFLYKFADFEGYYWGLLLTLNSAALKKGKGH